MKKSILIIIAVMMLFLLIACATNSSTGSNDVPLNEQNRGVEPTPTNDPTPDASSTPTLNPGTDDLFIVIPNPDTGTDGPFITIKNETEYIYHFTDITVARVGSYPPLKGYSISETLYEVIKPGVTMTIYLRQLDMAPPGYFGGHFIGEFAGVPDMILDWLGGDLPDNFLVGSTIILHNLETFSILDPDGNPSN